MAGVPVILILHRWTLMFLMMVVIKSYGLQTQQCSCYYFYSYSMSRRVADFRCKIDHNSTFVSMETIEEWAFIKMQIQNRTTDKLGGNQWHIGLEEKNGEWKWSSGQNLTYNKWRLGMPDYQWNNRFGVMNSATGLFRTTNDINPQGRICERKSNAQELCAVRWCPSTLFTTTPMSSISTTLSDHNKRINTSHIVTVLSTQSIRTSSIPPILLTTDQHQTSSKAPTPTTTNNSRNTYVIIVVVLAVILVLFSIFVIVQRCKRASKNSRQKRKDQFCQTEPIEMTPIGNMGNNDVTMTTVSGAEYEEIETMNKRNDSPKTMHGIPTIESEYEFAEDIPSIVDENNFVSMETQAGYTSLNKGTRISVDKNNHITMETEGGYTSLIKGTRTNGDNNNRISMEAGYTPLIKGASGNVDTNTHISMETETSGYASLIKGTLTT